MDRNRIKRALKSLMAPKQVPVKIPVFHTEELLEGKTAIVTGGGSGIGLSMAQKLCEAKCKVYILGRNESKLRTVSANINCNYKVLDVSKVETIENVVNEIFAESDVDILVNSAGILAGKNFGETDVASWDSVFNTNARGTYFMTQAVTNRMKERKIKGHVLNLSSSSALRPCYSVYNISKHIINDMTIGFAKELIPYGIVVNAIGPGPTATEMLGADEGDISNTGVPAGRFATVDEIANIALYLVSDLGNMIVGSTVYITGGAGITTCE